VKVKSHLLGAVGIVVVVGGVLSGQTPARPAFDAATVKPVPINSHESIDLNFQPGRFVATNVTLDLMITQAYGIEPRQLVGGPAWIHGDRFDITATTGGNVARDQVMLMLQALLADRFQLEIASEMQTGTVYTLTAPNAHDLKSPGNIDERPSVSTSREDANGYLSYHYDGHNATMAALALALAGQLRTPVSDQTRLTGSYDFRINWAYDSAFGGLEPDPNVPTIFTALQNEVGLKLTADKGPIQVYVVRSATKPKAD
jgi:uncharacterized protein (TIGR03435 family)